MAKTKKKKKRVYESWELYKKIGYTLETTQTSVPIGYVRMRIPKGAKFVLLARIPDSGTMVLWTEEQCRHAIDRRLMTVHTDGNLIPEGCTIENAAYLAERIKKGELKIYKAPKPKPEKPVPELEDLIL